MSLTKVAPDNILKVMPRLQACLEAMLVLGQPVRHCLANELLFGPEVRVECPVSEARLAHDPADARSRDPLPAEAFRGHIEDMPPSRRLVPLFETHLLSAPLISRSRRLLPLPTRPW